MYTVTRTKQELKSEEETSSSCEKVSKGRYETIKYVNERRDMERKTTKKGVDPFTFIASSRLINNAELHYILTSVFNIFLVERSLRLVTHFHRPLVSSYSLDKTSLSMPVFYMHSLCSRINHYFISLAEIWWTARNVSEVGRTWWWMNERVYYYSLLLIYALIPTSIISPSS